MVASRSTLDLPRNITSVAGRFKPQYDGLNRRTIEVPQYAAATYYIHQFYSASWQRLEMRPDLTTGNPPEQLQPYCQHVWSARYIDSPVLWDRDADNDSETGDLGKSGSGLEERLYYLGDANFNVTTLVDTSGEAVEHYQYDPYGRVKVLNGAGPDTDGDEWTDDPNNGTDVANVILYTGREYDSIICLYQYRHRYYHAELGRFLSRDPIAADINLYRYVFNNPLRWVDSLGLKKQMTLPDGHTMTVGDDAVLVKHKDDSYEILYPKSGTRLRFFYPPEGGYDPVEVCTNENGSTTINVNENCTIVIFYGHGKRTKPHHVNFVGTKAGCVGAAFMGCDAGATNKLIPEENRIPGASYRLGDIEMGGLRTSRREDERDRTRGEYWQKKLTAGAKVKAKSICDKSACGCNEVTIHYVRLEQRGDYVWPESHEETVKCSK